MQTAIADEQAAAAELARATAAVALDPGLIAAAEARVAAARTARDQLRTELNAEVTRIYRGPTRVGLGQLAADNVVPRARDLAARLLAADTELAAAEAALAGARATAATNSAAATTAEQWHARAVKAVADLRTTVAAEQATDAAEAAAAAARPVETLAVDLPCTPGVKVSALDSVQLANAARIVAVGRRLAVPDRGLVVAVATAMQESSLHNLANPNYPSSLARSEGSGSDHDSLGLFQQRPSMGWGTPEQVMVPEYAAERFYRKLTEVPGWEHLDLSVAAQAVQRSAFPFAYARHEPLARTVVSALLPCAVPAGDWVVPVRAEITSGFHTADRPDHPGVDLGAARGTAIRAAAAGTVVTSTCNASLGGQAYGCDVDGSVAVTGCGWYVDLRHADGVVTRYCHLLRRPAVTAGQTVAAGEILGYVGTSGNSSGPHLHLEVHLAGGDLTDPVAWMRQHGAPLG